MNTSVTILGAGFIGCNLLASCLARGFDVSVLDRRRCPVEYSGKCNWLCGDFTSQDDVRRAVGGADVVYHMISTTVPGDNADENVELVSNVVQTNDFLKLCVKEQVPRIVFMSSASVYGIQDEMPIDEHATTDPISSHGIHKLTIEKYLSLYQFEYGLNCKIMRLSNPYGRGQNINGRQGMVALAIGKIMKGQAICIRGDGSAIRDFAYIDDVVEALHLMATTGSTETTFNVGSGTGLSMREVVAIMAKLLGRDVGIHYSEGRKTDIPRSVMDITKARRVLGYSPRYTIEEGLKRTLAYHGLL